MKYVEKIKTRDLCSLTFFNPEYRAVFEITWKSNVEPERPHSARAMHYGQIRLQSHTQNV